METKTQTNCCGRNHGTIFIVGSIFCVIVFASVVIGLVGRHQKLEARNFGANQKKMMWRGYLPAPIDDKNQFIVPEDALKNGELAVTVDNLENARQKVTEIASKNGGTVYSTFISYASDDIKNGSIVVQVPIDKFDQAFGDLKLVGTQVIQETSQQIAPRTIYPMTQPAAANDASQTAQVAPAEKVSDNAAEIKNVDAITKTETTESAKATSAAVAIYPQPLQQAQDKGYIRVVFAAYNSKKAEGIQKITNTAGGFIDANYTGQNLRGSLWVVLGMKALLLMVLVGLLIFLLKRCFHNLHAVRKAKSKPVVHVVRQMPRSRARVVRIEKKK